jgi:tetratricopeptide (TPR) repeat protein
MNRRYENNYRYPGLRPFRDTDHDRRLFFGRDEETQYILHSILVENLFVLFAKSGLGKTSLIHAGLMALLRQNDLFPVVIRFNDRDKAPLDAIYPAVEKAAAERNEGGDARNKIDYDPGETDTLWQFFKTSAWWTSDDKRLTPVLIFDQFEEFFTLHSPERREAFNEQLADLVRGRVPRSLRESFKQTRGGRFPYSETPPQVKIIISMREDYLGYLEELAPSIPAILRSRFRLLPLKREKAREAIIKPARVRLAEGASAGLKEFSYAGDAVDEILDFLCERRMRGKVVKADDVEPFQLQLICQHLEEKIGKRKGNDKNTGAEDYCVQKADLGGKAGMRKIFQGFYEDRLKALGTLGKKIRVRKLCEKGLIENETRLSLHREYIIRKYKVSAVLLDLLVNNRLLMRSEPREGSVLYELSHDTLIQPILKSRRDRRRKIARTTVPILVVILIAAGIAITKQIVKMQEIDALYEQAERLKSLERDREAIVKYYSIVKIKKRQVAPYLEIGNLYEKKGNFKEALKIYEEAIENKAGDEMIYYRMGNIYARHRKNPDKAREYFEKAVEANPAFSEAYRTLGDLYNEQGRTEEAQGAYEKALELNNKNVDAYRNLLVLYIRNDRYDEAINVYRKAVNVSTAYDKIIEFIAKQINSWQVEYKLDTFYARAREMVFDEAPYYEKLGYDFAYFRDFDLAIENYKKALDLDDTNASTYERLALLYIKLEEPDKALDVYRDAVNASIDCADIYKEIGTELKKKRMTGECEALYRIAADVNPDRTTYFEDLADEFRDLGNHKEALENYNKALERSDRNDDAYKKLALLYIERGQPAEALAVYRRALAACPDCADIYRDIAAEFKARRMTDVLRVLYREAAAVDDKEASYYEGLGDDFIDLGEYETAVGNYQRALGIDERRASIYKKLALLHVERGEADQALAVYRRAAAISLDCANIYKDIARVLKEKEGPEKLEALYRSAAAVAVNDSLYYKGVGEGFDALGEYDQAVKNYEKALTIDNRDKLLYTRLTIAYIYGGTPDKAVDVYLRAVNVSADYAYNMMRVTARTLEEKGMTETIEKLYRAASGFESKDAVYYKRLGNAFDYLGEYDRAIENYERALNSDKKDISIYKNLAILYIRQKKPDEAIRVYRDAVKTSADYAYIIKDIAGEMKNMGMNRELDRLYRTASGLNPEDPTYQKELGIAFNKLDEYDRATKTLSKVARLDPEDHYALVQQGIAFRKQGKFDKAVDSYEKAIKSGLENASIFNMRGIAQGRKGDYEAARKSYRKAIELDPGFTRAKINLAELELITGNFTGAFDQAKQALWDENIQPWEKLPVTYISIAALFFRGKQTDALNELENFLQYYRESLSPKEYIRWEYPLSKRFIQESNILKTREKNLLIRLLEILESPRKVGDEELAEVEKMTTGSGIE